MVNRGSARSFVELTYATLSSWSGARRVIGRAEVTAQGDTPRFVVTNLPAEGFAGDPQESPGDWRRRHFTRISTAVAGRGKTTSSRCGSTSRPRG